MAQRLCLSLFTSTDGFQQCLEVESIEAQVSKVNIACILLAQGHLSDAIKYEASTPQIRSIDPVNTLRLLSGKGQVVSSK